MGCCCSSPERPFVLDSGDPDDSNKSDRSKKSKNGSGTSSDEESKQELKATQEAKPVYYIALWDYEAGGKAELSVKTGDRLQQLNDAGSEAGPEWVFATIMGGDRCGTGYVPRAFVAMEGSLEAERWFFGHIPRREAESYLSDAPAGTFLVRTREEDTSRRRDTKRAAAAYTISLKTEDGMVRHCQIWRLAPRYGDGFFVTKRKKFPSVSDLIQWYKREHPDEDVKYVLGEPPRKPVPSRIELSMEAQKNWREIPRSQITVVKEIGRGNFGVVFEGVWKSVSSVVTLRVAVKVLKRGSPSAKAQFLQEAVTMKNLSHRRLVKLFGVACSEEPYWLITEFVKDGSLRNYLKDRQSKSQPLSERTLIDICAQVAEGMRYLEEKLVVHRDLAARNVLVNERRPCTTAPLLDVKIADFGLAKLLQDPQTALQAHKKYRDIPVKWTAPEALKEAIYSHASDVWSFGVLCHEVFTHGLEPYPIMNGTMVKDYVVTKRAILQKHDKVPLRVYDLMIKCFRYYASERPKFKEIYAFFNNFYNDSDKSNSLSQLSRTRKKKAKTASKHQQAKSKAVVTSGKKNS